MVLVVTRVVCQTPPFVRIVVSHSDHHCPKGTCIILDAGTKFGPLIAGENGVHIFEMFPGTFERLEKYLKEIA